MRALAVALILAAGQGGAAPAAETAPEACTAAPPPAADGSTLFSDERPPVRFRGDTSAHITFLSPRAVNRACQLTAAKLPCGKVYSACTRRGLITAPNACDPAYADDPYAQIICHEAAHVLGWPATHGP